MFTFKSLLLTVRPPSPCPPLPYPPPAASRPPLPPPASLLSSSVLLIGKHMCLCLFLTASFFLLSVPLPSFSLPLVLFHVLLLDFLLLRPAILLIQGADDGRARGRTPRAPVANSGPEDEDARRQATGDALAGTSPAGAAARSEAEEPSVPTRPRARHERHSVGRPDPLDPFRRRVLVAFGSVWVGVGLVRFCACNDFLDLFSYPFLCFFYFEGAGSAGPLKKGSLFLPIPPNLLSYPASQVIRRPSPRNSLAGFWS